MFNIQSITCYRLYVTEVPGCRWVTCLLPGVIGISPQGIIIESGRLAETEACPQPLSASCTAVSCTEMYNIIIGNWLYGYVEQTLELALDEMSIYCSRNHLKPNPAKTQICCFHLRNRDAKHKLNVTWNGLELDHHPNPIYLGVTLDRTLSFKQHALNTKAKVNTRNNLFWGN